MTKPVAAGPKNAATGVVVIAPAVALADSGRWSGTDADAAAAAAAADANSGNEGSETGGKMEGGATNDDVGRGADAISSRSVGSTTPRAEAPKGSRATAK